MCSYETPSQHCPNTAPTLSQHYGLSQHTVQVPYDLWDPFGTTKKASPEKKAKSLVAEINNGTLLRPLIR